MEEAGKWNFYNEIDSKRASIWEAWWTRLNRMVWDEVRDSQEAIDAPFVYQTIYLLKNYPDDPFMDIASTPEVETANDLFLASFKEAVKDLNSWKSELGDYQWGDVKATYAGHLLQALPAFSRFNIPIGGNSGIVNATSKNHGASWRMIVEMSDPPKAFGVYPGGQSGNPGSKFYDDLVDIWAAGEYLELNFMQSADDQTGVSFTQTLNPKQ